jgi:hypothetical protein
VCVCARELTVAVFASDIEKMGCVRAHNCATYLSFDLTCVCVCVCVPVVYVRMKEEL